MLPTTKGDKNADWSELKSCDNVQFIISLSTMSIDTKTLFQVIPPSDNVNILSCKLSTPYRNSYDIRKYLLCHIKHVGKYYLSPSDDKELPPQCLPPGVTPVWVERTHLVSDTEVLEYCEQLTVGHTTVLYRDNYSDITRDWCSEQGWHYQDIDQFYGCEDKTVICWERSVIWPEAVSRARNRLILVTTRGR